MDDSESELDELLSEPLDVPDDDDVPEVDPELDSVVLVDCKMVYFAQYYFRIIFQTDNITHICKFILLLSSWTTLLLFHIQHQ